MSKNSSTPLLLIRALLHGSEVVAKRLSFLAQGGALLHGSNFRCHS
ncbi:MULTISPECIES: hypothetical protein [unclassified Rickettsia]